MAVKSRNCRYDNQFGSAGKVGSKAFQKSCGRVSARLADDNSAHLILICYLYQSLNDVGRFLHGQSRSGLPRLFIEKFQRFSLFRVTQKFLVFSSHMNYKELVLFRSLPVICRNQSNADRFSVWLRRP